MNQARIKIKPTGRKAHRNKGRHCRPIDAQDNPIAKLLEDNLLTATDIANHLDVSVTAVSQVIRGRSSSDRIVAAIAQATSMSMAEIKSIILAAAQQRLVNKPA